MELLPEPSLMVQQEQYWEEIQHRVDIGVIALQEGLVEYYDWFKTHRYWDGEELRELNTSADRTVAT